MRQNDVQNKIYMLVLKSLDGELSESENSILNDYLADNEHLGYYLKCVRMVDSIRNKAYYFELHDNAPDMLSYNELEKLALREDSFPAIELKKELEENDSEIDEVKTQKTNRFFKIFDKFVYVAAAMMIVFIVYAELFTPESSVQVATVVDHMDIKWSKESRELKIDDRLLTNQTAYCIEEGVINIKYDQGVDVVIEGPAKFSIERNGIYLESGRLYSVVSESGKGFTIDTPSSRYIDLGTEFGVDLTASGISELHVMNGKVQLYAGLEGQDKASYTVREGNAMRFNANNGELDKIALKESAFIRDMDSDAGVVWRGQKSLDLADIAAGGDGFGAGKYNVMLHPNQGITHYLTSPFSTSEEYFEFSDNQFVDGLFVPDGRRQQIVSSQGHVFAECPATSGFFDNQIVINPEPGLYTTNLRTGDIVFNGQLFGHGGLPCIVMHSNLGITIDLDAIRNKSLRALDRFECKIGIADLNEPVTANADFWVLIDGGVRYSLKKYNIKGVLNDVAVELNTSDRYLTLVATEGGDVDNPEGDFYERAISCDWCVFTEPVIIFE